MTHLFATDDKFADVVAELERRGWRRLPFVGCPKFDLKWTNYTKIAWTRVKPQQIVNHLHHSILFSQKDQFTELLYTHAVDQLQVDRCFPRTFDWSRPQDQRLLKCWFLYSEAVAVLQKSLKSTMATDQVEVAMEVARTLISDNFFERWRKEAGEFQSEKWEQLMTNSGLESVPLDNKRSLEIKEILEELRLRDQQFNALGSNNVWICKPSNLSQGRGIMLCSSMEELVEITSPGEQGGQLEAEFSSSLTKWIIQKYIERPLLLQNGRKFDIRQWVLITELEPKPTAFWFYRSYLRFCSRKFDLTCLHDRFTHLSNYSVQQHFAPHQSTEIDQLGSDVPGSIPRDQLDAMWNSEQFRESLRQEYGRDVWMETILPQMQSTARLALDAVFPKLKVVGRGFEWLGFDFLVDENHQVWLLEVNVSPDVSHSTNVTAELVPKATADALNVILDPVISRFPDNGWLPFALQSH